MHRRSHVPLLGMLLLAAFGIARAQDAYTSRPMNIHAGPDRDYPLVAQLDAGAPLDVHGCLEDWTWCDVSFDDGRGWIYAGGVSFVYQGDRVPLYSYGPRLGLPIITFSLGAYWGHYYRGRPWYSQRDTWEHRRMPEHTGPEGPPGAGPAPMPHTRPGPMRNERRPVEQTPGFRSEERGRSAPPEHAMPPRHAAPPEHAMPPRHAAPPEYAAPRERAAPPERGAQRTPHEHAPPPGGPPHSGGRPEHDNKKPAGKPPQDA